MLLWVAPAVAQAAMATGVARGPIDLESTASGSSGSSVRTRQVMRRIIALAQGEPSAHRVPRGRGDEDHRAPRRSSPTRASRSRSCSATASVIRARAAELDVDLVARRGHRGPPTRRALEDTRGLLAVAAAQGHDALRRAEGRCRASAALFGMMMVDAGDADGVRLRPDARLSGDHPPRAADHRARAPACARAAGMYMMLKGHDVLFCADTTVNIDPDAETLAEIAVCAADAVRDLGIEPRIAMLSFSNFGSDPHEPSA